eukprot:47942-Chlamydomonas_euryale.AAC.1
MAGETVLIMWWAYYYEVVSSCEWNSMVWGPSRCGVQHWAGTSSRHSHMAETGTWCADGLPQAKHGFSSPIAYRVPSPSPLPSTPH